MTDPDTDWKYLPVARLRELLATLPDDALVGPNAVLNLLITDAANHYAGYVDLAQEGVVVLVAS